MKVPMEKRYAQFNWSYSHHSILGWARVWQINERQLGHLESIRDRYNWYTLVISHNHGKIHHAMGKSTISIAIFQFAM